jgi:acyl-CoA oxidase
MIICLVLCEYIDSTITRRLLPQRVGPTPIDHSITTFNNVRIPGEALLGSLEISKDPKAALAQATWRIAIGSASIAGFTLPAMKAYATIGALYSMRRHVGPPNNRTPIIQFRTQQIPILTMVAQAYVMDAFLRWAQTLFRDTSIDPRVRHATSVIFKLTAINMVNVGATTISERCGAQGLFAHNQITTLHVCLTWTRHASIMLTRVNCRTRCGGSLLLKETASFCLSVCIWKMLPVQFPL